MHFSLFDKKTTHLLSHEHTLKWFRKEQYIPSTIIDRGSKEEWITNGKKTIGDRANERVAKLLKKYPGVTVENDKIKTLSKYFKFEGFDIRKILDT